MPAKVDNFLEIPGISFVENHSSCLPGNVKDKLNRNVLVALVCSVLIHLCGGWVFQHMAQEVPNQLHMRPIEVTIVPISSPPEKTIPLPLPVVSKSAKTASPASRTMPQSAPMPVTPPQQVPVVEHPFQPPPLKSLTEKASQSLPSLPVATSRETAPAVSHALSMPSLAHNTARSAKAATNNPTESSDGQSVIGPDFHAAYLNNPKPKYPVAARRLKLQGTVTVRVLVSEDGYPKRVTLGKSSGTTILDEVALEAVQHWSFVPARRGSKPVAAEVEVPLSFKLN